VQRTKKKPKFPLIDDFSDIELQKARELIYNETLALEKEQKEKEGKMTDEEDSSVLLKVPTQTQAEIWEKLEKDLCFLPSQKAYGLISTCSKEAQLQAFEQQFELLREQVVKETKKAQKVENVVQILIGGYTERAKSLRESLQDTFSQYEDNLSDLDCFEMLAKQESVAMPNRIHELQGQVEVHKAKENELQARYAHLRTEKESLEALLAH